MRRGVVELVLALGLALVATLVVVHNQRAVGIARDEVVYMHAGSRYAAWWAGLLSGKTGLTRASITDHFGGKNATDNNREHPPLLKTLAGACERLLHDELGALDELTAYRLPSALLHGGLLALIFLYTARYWGALAGVLAASFMLLMPRPLFHAGLLCFDGPITTLWFATLVAYHRALVTGRRAWLAGVAFGLALATKHNALLLPFAVGAHYAIVCWQRRAAPPAGSAAALAGWRRWAHAVRSTGQCALALRPRVLLWPAALGPLVLVALWPWLWFEPLRHLGQWIGFHTHHVHYNFEYLGRNWNAPPFPWHVALVTTWLTVPAVTLASALVGIWALARRARPAAARPDPSSASGSAPSSDPASASSTSAATYAPGLLLLLSAAASMGPFFLGSTPIFGAEKHWEPAIPSLAIAAALGLTTCGAAAARWLGRRLPRLTAATAHRLVLALLAAAALGSAAVETFHPQPYGLTAYNALAGGAPGAADLGMNRQFWGVAARGVLGELARLAPPGGAQASSAASSPVLVYTHDAAPAWGVYRRLGLVPPRFTDAGPESYGVERSQLALVIHERHFARHDFLIWQSYGTVQPVFVLRLDGVPLVSVYRRPSPAAPPAAASPAAPPR